MKLCRMCHNFTLQIIFIFRFIWSDRPVWAIKMNKRRTQKRRQNDWLLRILRKLLSEVQNLCLKECWCGNSNQKNVIIERTKKKYVVKGTIGTLKSIVSYQPTKIIEQSSEERQPTDESD